MSCRCLDTLLWLEDIGLLNLFTGKFSTICKAKRSLSTKKQNGLFVMDPKLDFQPFYSDTGAGGGEGIPLFGLTGMCRSTGYGF